MLKKSEILLRSSTHWAGEGTTNEFKIAHWVGQGTCVRWANENKTCQKYTIINLKSARCASSGTKLPKNTHWGGYGTKLPKNTHWAG